MLSNKTRTFKWLRQFLVGEIWKTSIWSIRVVPVHANTRNIDISEYFSRLGETTLTGWS